MRDENGKTPLGWVVTIVITLLVAGVVVAMLFGDNEQVSNKIKEQQNKNNTVQTQEK